MSHCLLKATSTDVLVWSATWQYKREAEPTLTVTQSKHVETTLYVISFFLRLLQFYRQMQLLLIFSLVIVLRYLTVLNKGQEI